MVIDVFTYNGEADILEIRLNILNDYVDQFIIVEAPLTFSGKSKPSYYEAHKDRFARWQSKIKYHIVEHGDTTIEEMAQNSPNTVGAAHWKEEFYQKESIKKALTHLQDNDVVFIGDVDEIWHPAWLDEIVKDLPVKLKLRVYTYYLNNSSSEIFWGTLVSTYKDLKHECLNHLRSNSNKKIRGRFNKGWHFTSMAPELRRKLTDSYTEETYANPTVMDNLDENVKNNRDFLGRNFTYKVDESEWPQWLKDNRQHYQHMLK